MHIAQCFSFTLFSLLTLFTIHYLLFPPVTCNLLSYNLNKGGALGSYIQVFITIDKREEADMLSRLLVDKRLAACVQVVGPITSTYRWKGKVEQSEEWLCIAKSREGLFNELERVVMENHSYDVPEILAIPVTAGSKSYLKWLDEQISEPDVE